VSWEFSMVLSRTVSTRFFFICRSFNSNHLAGQIADFLQHSLDKHILKSTLPYLNNVILSDWLFEMRDSEVELITSMLRRLNGEVVFKVFLICFPHFILWTEIHFLYFSKFSNKWLLYFLVTVHNVKNSEHNFDLIWWPALLHKSGWVQFSLYSF